MPGRGPQRSSSRKSLSSYKMTRTATMRKQENMRRYSRTQTSSQRLSRVRMSRVSVASSRNSMRSAGGSRKSVASVAPPKVTRKSSRQDASTSKVSVSPNQIRVRRKNKPSASRISSEAHVHDDGLEEILDAAGKNEEFMASNYTYSMLSSEDFVLPKVIPADDILYQPQTPELTEESGWRIMNYIKSVKNSIFKEPENVKSTGNEERVVNADKRTTLEESKEVAVLNADKSKVGTNSGNLNGRRISKDTQRYSTQITSKLHTHENNAPKKEIRQKKKASEVLLRSTGSVNLKRDLLKKGSDISLGPGCSSKGPKSALKGSKSQSSIGQSRISSSNVRRVSILASLGSLEDMATSLAFLEREKTLEAIRRLEDVAKEKRRQLAETRLKMRESLEEEMQINKKLESILQKIRLIRKAGEEASLIFDKETQVFTTSRYGNKPKKL